MQNNTGSETTTEGIRVQVFPEYVPVQSNPELNRFVFSYRVVITNEGDRWAKLLSRRWLIINAEETARKLRGLVLLALRLNFTRVNLLNMQAQHLLTQTGVLWKVLII